MRWRMSHRADPAALPMADIHYSRQKPGTPQFVAPGSCVCFIAGPPGRALWVTSWPLAQYTKHAWAGAWVNSMFHNDGAGLASELILEAVAATRYFYGPPPPLGMVTFIDAAKVEHKRSPGRIYKLAGFVRDGETKGGLIVWRMPPEAMPAPECPRGLQPRLFVV